MSKVKKIFDRIPEARREWVIDEGRWLHYRLFYNDKIDTIHCEVTNRYGDWVDCYDVTEEYL